MMKHLAILGFLLVAAMPPMPGQAIKPAAQGSDKRQSQGYSDKSTAAPAPSFVNKPIETGSTQPNGGSVTGEDKEQSVKLTGLPPTALTDKPKTLWNYLLDWGPWAFNFGLVAVGILQVILLKRTWKTIERQADIMDSQAKDARESSAEATKIALATAQAAKQSADAASAQIKIMKAKERAQIRIDFGEVSEVTGSYGQALWIPYKITVDGVTKATILQTFIAAWIETPGTDRRCFAEMDIPQVLSPVPEPWHLRVNVTEDDVTHPRVVAPERIRSVKDNEKFVVVQGEIRYQDVFEDIWVRPFALIWKNYSLYGGKRGGSWWPYAGADANTEHREESTDNPN